MKQSNFSQNEYHLFSAKRALNDFSKNIHKRIGERKFPVYGEEMISLTGDRPSGLLHLGHYVGSLRTRLELQGKTKQFLMIADVQTLTDQQEKGMKKNIEGLILDYLAVGLKPELNTIFCQSDIPELFELTIYLLNLVSWQQLQHNPTVKTEIRQKGFEKQVPAGFFTYPVSQAADILAFKANIVPVGEDQLPMIEQARKLARAFNKRYGETLVLPKAKLSSYPRLPGTDGAEKMGKSLGNAIYLSDSADVVANKVKKMLSDPKHLEIDAPGYSKKHPVFAYLAAFDRDKPGLAELRARYDIGGVSDQKVKERLALVLEEAIAPIREKRKTLAKEIDIEDLLKQGKDKAREIAIDTLQEIREGIGI